MVKEQAPIHIIAGPTASGKSAKALALAESSNGVIINADSLQLYDALPILTAQPDAADKARAPHALYTILSPSQRCSAARWRSLAMTAIDAAQAAGQTPILTGGTGLYLKALMRGLSPIPDVPPEIRAQVMARQAALGNPAFHTEFAARDPVMGARLAPGDTQRLVRAWEVQEATGRSLAEWQAMPPEPPPSHYRFILDILAPPRDELYHRCNARFDQMLVHGALDEVRAFKRRLDSGTVPDDSPALNALGYRPLVAFLSGEISSEDAIDRAKTDTRQYAKRQVTWFRHQFAGWEDY